VEAGVIELYHPVTQTILPSQVAGFAIRAEAGEFIRVRVDYQVTHVLLRLMGPDGKVLASVSNITSAYGSASASAIAASSGVFHVTVGADSASRNPAFCQIELTHRERATAQHEIRLKAEALLRSANLDSVSQSKDKREHAIEEYSQSGALWRLLGDAPEEALGLLRTGQLHFSAGRHPQAVECFENALRIARLFGDRFTEVSTLLALGGESYSTGDYRSALRHFEQALANIREFGGNEALRKPILATLWQT